jgi:hypothetical protein
MFMQTTQPTQSPIPMSPSFIQFFEADMLALPAGQRMTMAILSVKYGMSKATIRAALLSTYGDRVFFDRGRTGGIRIV